MAMAMPPPRSHTSELASTAGSDTGKRPSQRKAASSERVQGVQGTDGNQETASTGNPCDLRFPCPAVMTLGQANPEVTEQGTLRQSREKVTSRCTGGWLAYIGCQLHAYSVRAPEE